MKARIVKTIPLKIPFTVPASAFCGLNGASERSPRFERIIQIASSRKTPTSKIPSATPAFVESRTSR